MSEHCHNADTPKSSAKKAKRPDKPLYVPPGGKHPPITVIEEASWDALYEDDGSPAPGVSSTTPTIVSQLAGLTLGSPTAKTPTSDEEAEQEPPTCGTILEVYDFSAELKTRDLITSLSATNYTFNLEWVDETHALAVFNTSAAASEALSKDYLSLKLRPLNQATKASQEKALLRGKGVDAPRRPRPETTTLLASRLIAGALGIKADIDPELRRAEREKLRRAKEKKQQKQHQTKNIWEGNVS